MNKKKVFDYDLYFNVAKEVCNHYQITIEDIKGLSRVEKIRDARMIISTICRQKGMTLKFIGICMGNRDHATISNHVKKLEWDREYNKKLNSDFLMLKDMILDESWIERCGTL